MSTVEVIKTVPSVFLCVWVLLCTTDKGDLLFLEVGVTPDTEYSHSVVHNVHTNQGSQYSSVPTYTLVVHNVAF